MVTILSVRVMQKKAVWKQEEEEQGLVEGNLVS